MSASRLYKLRDAIRRDSCGCATGSIFLGAALALSTIWYAWHWAAWRRAAWPTAGKIAAYSMGAALVGKMVGLLLYQRQHARRSRPVKSS